MLNSDIIRKIESFIYQQPRSIDEVAKFLHKNWRTADRYIKEIEKEYGTVTTKVFREGSRGALKVVYWSSIEKVSNSAFQEILEQQILLGKTKYDFSAFDIFQHISDEKKFARIEDVKKEEDTDLESFTKILHESKKQVLMFSGNLSFINLRKGKIDLFNEMESLAKRGVSIKVLCRVDLVGLKNVERMLSINFKLGKEMIEIRHRGQPLRVDIIDNKIITMKEVQEPTGKVSELQKTRWIFYTVKDKEWAEWLSRIFWKMFATSVDARKRIEELKKIK